MGSNTGERSVKWLIYLGAVAGWTESEDSEIVVNHDVMAHIFQQRLIPYAPSYINPN